MGNVIFQSVVVFLRGALVVGMVYAMAAGGQEPIDAMSWGLVTGNPVTTVFGREEHGGHDQNWDIMQADNGSMYVANGHGLMEWDGERWRSYPSPGTTRLRGVTKWTDGLVYTGTLNDLGVYRPDTNDGLVYQSLLQRWPDERRKFGEVWSLTSNSRWVVFATTDQLMVYDGDTVRIVDGIKPGPYRVFSVEDRILIKRVASPDLLELTGDTELQLKVVSSSLPPDAFPMAIDALNNGWRIVTAVHGVLHVTTGSATVLVPPEAFGEQVVLFSSLIDDDGYHYIGTLKHGLFVLSPDAELLRNYQQEHGLGVNTVLSIAQDRQGSLWLAGAPAITRMYPPRKVSRFATDDNSMSLDLLVRHAGHIYLAGFGFYVLRANDNPLFPPEFRSVQSMRNDQIWDVHSVGDDLLLATNEGVVRLRMDQRGEVVQREIIAPSDFAFDIEPGLEPGVYFASTQDGLVRFEQSANNVWTYVRVEGIDTPQRKVLVDSDQKVWLRSDNNELLRVSAIDPQTGAANVERFDQVEIIGERTSKLLRWGDSAVFATSRGLLDYRDGEFERSDALAKIPGTSDVAVDFLQTDAQGRVWMEANQRFLLAVPGTAGWQVRRKLFGVLPSQQLNSVFDVAPDTHPDQMWLVFEEAGVLAVDLAEVSQDPSRPVVQIRSVVELDSDATYFRGYGEAAIAELDQQSNSLRIRYAVADFLADGASLYRTRLLGSGANAWSDWTTESQKDYTLLDGGDYRFQVQAQDPVGNISPTVTLPFTVAPAWYLERQMIALYVLLALLSLALAVWAGARWRKGKTQAKQKELEQLVAERTAALGEANQRLEVLANSDGLTGLANRRHLDAYLDELARDRRQAGVIIIDVDHFKRFNDTHGHLAGDDALKSVANILAQLVSAGSSLVSRYGGEEFVVVMPDQQADAVETMANRLREAVEKHLRVTVSLGVACSVLQDDADIKRLLNSADQALYDAKQLGRNRVVFNQSDAPPGLHTPVEGTGH